MYTILKYDMICHYWYAMVMCDLWTFYSFFFGCVFDWKHEDNLEVQFLGLFNTLVLLQSY
jgi:hypothetical protein